MDKFLVNMAVIKVNWDQSRKDILDNYIPLIAHSLASIQGDVFSLEEFKQKFKIVAEFDIPTGAIMTLLKRAAKSYKYLQKQSDGLYKINKPALENNNYEVVRDAEQRKFNQLKLAFSTYCRKSFNLNPDPNEIDEYFFETLYDIAPSLFNHVSDIDNLEIEKTKQKQFLISKFISHANKVDQASFEAIVSFVRGAMLTETFYYSNPADIQNKMRQVKVFFDTQFLLRALGLTDASLTEPCLELIEMLKKMSVKMRCFRHTYDEIHKILTAAARTLDRHGRLTSYRPGDVFDHFSRSGSSASDVELLIAKLDENLEKRGIIIEEKPEHITEYTISEEKLSNAIDQEIRNQNKAARNHDIDCLTAVHRLRLGKPQKYLESCEAIFITTNSGLARASTEFFNTEYGASNAPVCMGDQVFTTLIWLKAVKKIPDLPKDRLVANCYAATLPSEVLWGRYVTEAERLKKQGNIGENDYAVLVHSLEARNRLMELTFGEDEIVQGTVEEVLRAAKENYISEVRSELDQTKQHLSRQRSKLENISKMISVTTEKVVRIGLLIIWFVVLIYGIFYTSPSDILVTKLFSFESWIFLILCLVTLLSLIFGYKINDHCVRIARLVSDAVEKYFNQKFIS